MPSIGGTGLPSLSQIQAWDTGHLHIAAREWIATAEQWDAHFASVHRESVHPGGTLWEGVAAEAAQRRTAADVITVGALADGLHAAAACARRGAGDLEYAKRFVQYAIRDAEEAEFDVGEDLSVSDRMAWASPADIAARQAQAEEFAAQIATRAASLKAMDEEVAAGITKAILSLGEVRIGDPPSGAQLADPYQPSGVMAVDFKQDGGPQPAPQPPTFSDEYGKYITGAPSAEQSAPGVPMPSFGDRPPSQPGTPGPMPVHTPMPSFGQCVGGHMQKDNIGLDMVKDGFKSAVEKAALGAVIGAGLTPEAAGAGALPGGVLGFVGGFAQGVIEAPVKSAVEGAWDCLVDPFHGTEEP